MEEAPNLQTKTRSKKGGYYKHAKMWTTGEELLLVACLVLYGPDWKTMEKHIPDRSSNMLKTKVYNSLRTISVKGRLGSGGDFNKAMRDAQQWYKDEGNIDRFCECFLTPKNVRTLYPSVWNVCVSLMKKNSGGPGPSPSPFQPPSEHSVETTNQVYQHSL
ncbi:hypothetical protein QR46_4183 [Giardia duodenalis assemblage B]|uniref:Myb-like domain-containing protein n=3 Tax=Giardia intestinalis TaxID=5741 RepID=A0A132NP69_GIAIN|nr:Hypothetical protein GL50581_1211 [Giardia intestinalis ATCC 50581]ESU41302.1 Hypothetical protein GSB_11990 [Giardia intestinalis]KWX11844.1 hypothetical protein QR46_4183 [Giardia intestinalis assemblage B]